MTCSAYVRASIRTSGHKLLKQTAPLLTKQVGTSQTTITANAHQVSDAAVQQVQRSTQAAFTLSEVLTTCTPDYRSTLHSPGKQHQTTYAPQLYITTN